MLEPESRLRHRDRVLTQRAAGTLVLLDLDSGQYYTLDEVSSRVWDLCDGELGVEAIVSTIGEEFEAPLETIQGDIEEFLQEMLDENLLVEES